jgi:hypothetical protein
MNIEPRENGKMIDIKEEIKRYMPIGMTDVYNRAAANSLVQAVQTFSGVLKRISKEQYKYSHLLEEVLEAVEGINKISVIYRNPPGRIRCGSDSFSHNS